MAITYENQFNGYSILTNKDKNMGCDTKILQRLQDQTEYMTNKHCKVLQLRIDIRYPEDFTKISQEMSKDHVSTLNKNLKRNLERNYKVPKEGKQRSERTKPIERASKAQHRIDPMMTFVVEEHGRGAHPHAHALIQVNGNAKRNPIDIQKRAEREWATVLGIEDAKGLIHYCDDKKNNKPGAYLIDRHTDFTATQDEAFRQASYLAKLRGKEDRPKGAWSVTGTRIPSRHKHED